MYVDKAAVFPHNSTGEWVHQSSPPIQSTTPVQWLQTATHTPQSSYWHSWSVRNMPIWLDISTALQPWYMYKRITIQKRPNKVWTHFLRSHKAYHGRGKQDWSARSQAHRLIKNVTVNIGVSLVLRPQNQNLSLAPRRVTPAAVVIMSWHLYATSVFTYSSHTPVCSDGYESCIIDMQLVIPESFPNFYINYCSNTYGFSIQFWVQWFLFHANLCSRSRDVHHYCTVAGTKFFGYF